MKINTCGRSDQPGVDSGVQRVRVADVFGHCGADRAEKVHLHRRLEQVGRRQWIGRALALFGQCRQRLRPGCLRARARQQHEQRQCDLQIHLSSSR